MAGDPSVSVLMPVYNGAAFLARAVDSLCAQTLTDWELILVDDGSTDGTPQIYERSSGDDRIRVVRLDRNGGLGAALNRGLADARAPLIAYLPADDVFHAGHLASLAAALDARPEAILAYSGVRHHYNRYADGPIDGYPLQLVQVMHRKTADRWMERRELVTDDLERMYWAKLRPLGPFVATGEVTCEWVAHPDQRHRTIQEPVGGINPYRVRYAVQEPLRFHSTTGNAIDEVEQYRRFRERPDTPRAADGLTVLLAGELAYNAERVLALEERGHSLYGLWMPDPYWYNTVGPLPFGHVQDLPRTGWQDAVRRLQPDVIYALLNWQAVPFAHQVQSAFPDIPFVWHYKEGPFIDLEKGTWPQLVDIYRRAHGVIYCSEEMRDWFYTVLPDLRGRQPSMVLDGDLPKADWFTAPRSPRLSQHDGEIHTVVPGRPIGLHSYMLGDLARMGIHLHFYGDFTHGQWKEWIDRARSLAPRHLHLHPNVSQEGWVSEFSQYDAGWLHVFKSRNRGDLQRADWDDLNIPARMATLAVAGLPMLQADNTGSRVAIQTVSRERDIGLFIDELGDLAALFREDGMVSRVRENVWAQRADFTFDAHADRLVAFFREVAAAV